MTSQEEYELALSLYQAGRLRDAESHLHRVMSRDPMHADAFHLMGVLCHRYGRSPMAAGFIRRAISLNPASPDYHDSLAMILAGQGAADQALSHLRQALTLRPDFPQALCNQGILLARQGLPDQAIASFQRAIDLRPVFPEAISNLANVLKDTGRIDEALACYASAANATADPRAVSNLIYTMHFHPAYNAPRLAIEHARWNQVFARPLAAERRPHANDRDPHRRLRIGYVSPDFREHSVARGLAPLLAHHNRDGFEVFCYSDVQWPDEMTRRLQSFDHAWRNTFGLSHDALTDLVREDRIDVLVDLTMHMEGSRLMTFARKPAPVQLTYLAYCGTTGVDAIDYRLTDPYLDPPEMDQSVYVEKSWRLDSYRCYLAPEVAPQVGPLPAAESGWVTFGCLNNFSKVSQTALSLWRAILRQVPRARLVLHAPEGNHRQRLLDQFAADGVESNRIEFVVRTSFEQYLRRHGAIDIALDPFPYGGAMTTCDALWMGAPVVSLAGQTAVSRAGASILSTIGLAELLARTPDQYVQIAASLADDLPRLTQLRTALRQRMRSSSLMNAQKFAANIEAAFREMWRQWCASRV